MGIGPRPAVPVDELKSRGGEYSPPTYRSPTGNGCSSRCPGVVEVWSRVAPAVPLERVSTGAALQSRALEPMRLTAALIGAFAAVALGIAAVGLYSTIAWRVEQRSREIAVRIALGGAPRSI